MSARAIWQGTLVLQKRRIGVKLYSAVLDRQIHFHLLHKRDRTRIQQRMVDSQTEEPVPLDQGARRFRPSLVCMSLSRLRKSSKLCPRQVATSR